MLPIDEITQELKEVRSPSYIEQELLTDPEEGEVPLGTISPRAQRLLTLSMDYQRRLNLAMHTATYDAETKAEKKLFEAQARRHKAMAELIRNLAWVEAHDSVEGGWDTAQTLMRKDWVMVAATAEPEVEVEVLGGFPVTAETVKHVRRLIKRMEQARADGELDNETLQKKDERKVQ